MDCSKRGRQPCTRNTQRSQRRKDEFIESDFDVLGSPSNAQRFQIFMIRDFPLVDICRTPSREKFESQGPMGQTYTLKEDDVPVLFADSKASTQMRDSSRKSGDDATLAGRQLSMTIEVESPQGGTRWESKRDCVMFSA